MLKRKRESLDEQVMLIKYLIQELREPGIDFLNAELRNNRQVALPPSLNAATVQYEMYGPQIRTMHGNRKVIWELWLKTQRPIYRSDWKNNTAQPRPFMGLRELISPI